MIKNNFLMLTALLALASCSSNVNKNTTPVSESKNMNVEGQAVRTIVDPRPAINDHMDNVNRHVGTTTTIIHDNKPTK